MKYCANYSKYMNYMDQLDEVVISYKGQDTSLPNFIEIYPNKTIILNFDMEFIQGVSEKEFEIEINKIKSVIENRECSIKIILDYNAKDFCRKAIRNYGIPFMENISITTWKELDKSLRKGVSDIRIDGELGFSLPLVRQIVGEEICIRVIPNGTSFIEGLEDETAIKNFFIRPEDIDEYSQYIDVCDIFIGKPHQIPILLKVYKEQKVWAGDLREIISGFNIEIDNRFVAHNFAEMRIKCGQTCLKGNKCRYCDRIEPLAATLKENNVVPKKH